VHLAEYYGEGIGSKHHEQAVTMLIESGVLGEYTQDDFFGTIPW
jgi:hypothetical protein